MREKDSKNKSGPEIYAWKTFEKTGDISYYLLYKRLTEKNK